MSEGHSAKIKAWLLECSPYQPSNTSMLEQTLNEIDIHPETIDLLYHLIFNPHVTDTMVDAQIYSSTLVAAKKVTTNPDLEEFHHKPFIHNCNCTNRTNGFEPGQNSIHNSPQSTPTATSTNQNPIICHQMIGNGADSSVPEGQNGLHNQFCPQAPQVPPQPSFFKQYGCKYLLNYPFTTNWNQSTLDMMGLGGQNGQNATPQPDPVQNGQNYPKQGSNHYCPSLSTRSIDSLVEVDVANSVGSGDGRDFDGNSSETTTSHGSVHSTTTFLSTVAQPPTPNVLPMSTSYHEGAEHGKALNGKGYRHNFGQNGHNLGQNSGPNGLNSGQNFLHPEDSFSLNNAPMMNKIPAQYSLSQHRPSSSMCGGTMLLNIVGNCGQNGPKGTNGARGQNDTRSQNVQTGPTSPPPEEDSISTPSTTSLGLKGNSVTSPTQTTGSNLLPATPALPISNTTHHLPIEPNRGCIEYKLLVAPTSFSRFETLMTQLLFRIGQSPTATAFYSLGVDDHGTIRLPLSGSLTGTYADLFNFGSGVIKVPKLVDLQKVTRIKKQLDLFKTQDQNSKEFRRISPRQQEMVLLEDATYGNCIEEDVDNDDEETLLVKLKQNVVSVSHLVSLIWMYYLVQKLNQHALFQQQVRFPAVYQPGDSGNGDMGWGHYDGYGQNRQNGQNNQNCASNGQNSPQNSTEGNNNVQVLKQLPYYYTFSIDFIIPVLVSSTSLPVGGISSRPAKTKSPKQLKKEGNDQNSIPSPSMGPTIIENGQEGEDDAVDGGNVIGETAGVKKLVPQEIVTSLIIVKIQRSILQPRDFPESNNKLKFMLNSDTDMEHFQGMQMVNGPQNSVNFANFAQNIATMTPNRDPNNPTQTPTQNTSPRQLVSAPVTFTPLNTNVNGGYGSTLGSMNGGLGSNCTNFNNSANTSTDTVYSTMPSSPIPSMNGALTGSLDMIDTHSIFSAHSQLSQSSNSTLLFGYFDDYGGNGCSLGDKDDGDDVFRQLAVQQDQKQKEHYQKLLQQEQQGLGNAPAGPNSPPNGSKTVKFQQTAPPLPSPCGSHDEKTSVHYDNQCDESDEKYSMRALSTLGNETQGRELTPTMRNLQKSSKFSKSTKSLKSSKSTKTLHFNTPETLHTSISNQQDFLESSQGTVPNVMLGVENQPFRTTLGTNQNENLAGTKSKTIGSDSVRVAQWFEFYLSLCTMTTVFGQNGMGRIGNSVTNVPQSPNVNHTIDITDSPRPNSSAPSSSAFPGTATDTNQFHTSSSSSSSSINMMDQSPQTTPMSTTVNATVVDDDDDDFFATFSHDF